MNNYPCKCGHKENIHEVVGSVDHRVYCKECYFKIFEENLSLEGIEKSFHKFTPDNLKYLEDKYTQQILDKYRSLSKEIHND